MLFGRIFAACADFNVYEFSVESEEVRCYEGHTDYINHLCTHPTPGLAQILASVSGMSIASFLVGWLKKDSELVFFFF